jgi:hypothetical protein
MNPADGERDQPTRRVVGADEFVGVTVGDGCRHAATVATARAVVILISRPARSLPRRLQLWR